MNKVGVFNGFVRDPFNVIHQTPGQMQEWYDKLRDSVPDVTTMTEARLEDCWAYDMVHRIGSPVYSADHPNEPRDRYLTPTDALRSQILLHQRFYWLSKIAQKRPEIDTWCWIEGTVFKQRGVTKEVIQRFVRDVTEFPFAAISLPGVWPKQPIKDEVNHWRFVGSTWVCPKQYVLPLFNTVLDVVMLRTRLTKRLCWDNSTLSYIELLNVLPMRWYPGNHDETQFTNYLSGG